MARWSRMFHGRPASVGEARRFARLILAGHMLADLAELVVSELGTNAVEHSASGSSGGFFVVELEVFRDHVTVAVVDMGSNELPVLAEEDPAQPVSLGGRGLHIVEAVAKDWGCHRVRVGLRVWADICHPGMTLAQCDTQPQQRACVRLVRCRRIALAGRRDVRDGEERPAVNV